MKTTISTHTREQIMQKETIRRMVTKDKLMVIIDQIMVIIDEIMVIIDEIMVIIDEIMVIIDEIMASMVATSKNNMDSIEILLDNPKNTNNMTSMICHTLTRQPGTSKNISLSLTISHTSISKSTSLGSGRWKMKTSSISNNHQGLQPNTIPTRNTAIAVKVKETTSTNTNPIRKANSQYKIITNYNTPKEATIKPNTTITSMKANTTITSIKVNTITISTRAGLTLSEDPLKP